MEVILEKLGIALNYTQELLLVALMLGRTVALVVLTPWLGGKLIPPEVKMAISTLLVILVWPLARRNAGADIPVTAIPFFMLMLKEIFIGFAIGFAAAHVFWAVEVAGRIIDTVRGASMAEVMVPLSGERATPFGDMFYQLLVVFFLALGGHRIFFEAFFFSFETLPIAKHIEFGPGLIPFFDVVVKITAEILLIGTLLAAPVIAATFITDLVFGILNRVAPQLNAYFLSMPVKAMAGVILVIVGFEALVGRMEYYVVWSLRGVEQLIDLLQVG